MNRRKFLTKLGLGTAAVAAGGVVLADVKPITTYTHKPYAAETVITKEALEDMLVARAMETDANGLLVHMPKDFKVHPAFTRNESWFLS